MEHFETIVNSGKVNYFHKTLHHAWQGSEYACVLVMILRKMVNVSYSKMSVNLFWYRSPAWVFNKEYLISKGNSLKILEFSYQASLNSNISFYHSLKTPASLEKVQLLCNLVSFSICTEFIIFIWLQDLLFLWADMLKSIQGSDDFTTPFSWFLWKCFWWSSFVATLFNVNSLFGAFIVTFEQIWQIVLLLPLMTLNK